MGISLFILSYSLDLLFLEYPVLQPYHVVKNISRTTPEFKQRPDWSESVCDLFVIFWGYFFVKTLIARFQFEKSDFKHQIFIIANLGNRYFRNRFIASAEILTLFPKVSLQRNLSVASADENILENTKHDLFDSDFADCTV